MGRRSRFAAAAESWIRKQGTLRAYSSAELWAGLCAEHAELTTPTSDRKTPRATCMRDLRADRRFSVSQGVVRLMGVDEPDPTA